jgi:SAM-dependent methyltransferase
MDVPVGHDKNADQIAYWNGPGGKRWSDRQASQDVLLGPVSQALIARAGIKPGERVLDIGCGCGSTSIALALAVAPAGFVLGVDISAPMLERARQVAPEGLPLDFVLADATLYPFHPETFDLLISRFGVMFFADPVLSFANLRRALRPSGRVAFVCWREPRDNPWMMAPLHLSARAKTAAGRAGGARSVRLRLRGARAAHSSRGGLLRRCNGALRSLARHRRWRWPRGSRAGRVRNRPGQPGAGRALRGDARESDGLGS